MKVISWDGGLPDTKSEAAFREAEIIIERTYTTPQIEHNYLSWMSAGYMDSDES